MWIKHFLDSILGAELFPSGAKCLEVGSGGGFPSVPLKIFRDDLSFTLVESTGKKCEYLKDACKKLELKGVEVVSARAEELSRDDKYMLSTCTVFVTKPTADARMFGVVVVDFVVV